MWGAILSAVASIVGSGASAWTNAKNRQAEVEVAKHEVKLAKIRSNDSSWKDEFLILIWSYPVISLFIPYEPLQEHTYEALEKIGVLPDWFIGGWLAISLSVFGVNKLVSIKGKK